MLYADKYLLFMIFYLNVFNRNLLNGSENWIYWNIDQMKNIFNGILLYGNRSWINRKWNYIFWGNTVCFLFKFSRNYQKYSAF